MSIKGIKPGQVIPFPNKQVDKKTEKSVEYKEIAEGIDIRLKQIKSQQSKLTSLLVLKMSYRSNRTIMFSIS